MSQYRHGDVYLRQVERLPEGVQQQQRTGDLDKSEYAPTVEA